MPKIFCSKSIKFCIKVRKNLWAHRFLQKVFRKKASGQVYCIHETEDFGSKSELFWLEVRQKHELFLEVFQSVPFYNPTRNVLLNFQNFCFPVHKFSSEIFSLQVLWTSKMQTPTEVWWLKARIIFARGPNKMNFFLNFFPKIFCTRRMQVWQPSRKISLHFF